MGQFSAAAEAYCTALRLDPRDITTRGYRGWAYLATGAVRLALEDFEGCLRESPQSTDFLIGRASARIRLSNPQWREALADAVAAEQQGAVSPQLLYHLCCVYAQAGSIGERDRLAVQYENKALRYLQRALEEMPESQRKLFWRGQVESDPTLAAIRRTTSYRGLARRYGQEEK
jgi:tetratricopeptide (TPR) repeat protein